ncbi:MAG: site-specific DNA-methyltransferase [Nanoarchaeota archaeon]|nr:site-specific DNA-methyltransferase [Nanoarchaeota archaeon]
MWSEAGETVLDPFCGCGTTLLESSLMDRPSIGVDNNAVACLISRAKTQQYTRIDFENIIEFEKTLNKKMKKITLDEVWKPVYENMGYWFAPEAIDDLSRLLGAINTLSGNPRIFALAVFSSIVVRVSFQDSDTRYTRVNKEYQNGDAIRWYQNKQRDMNAKLQEIIDLPRASCSVYLNDSRDIPFIQNNSVKLIVTSPPYLNAYDYHKYHRHRLQWIEGDVKLARDLEIGKHDTFTRKGAKPEPYFKDMERCFLEWYRILKLGGRALIVVGDAIVSGKPVPVGDKFLEICEEIGFYCEKRWTRKLLKTKKSFHPKSRIDKEHLLLFKK